MKFANVEFVAFDSADVIATSLWLANSVIEALEITVIGKEELGEAAFYGIKPWPFDRDDQGALTVTAFKATNGNVTNSETTGTFAFTDTSADLEAIVIWISSNGRVAQ